MKNQKPFIIAITLVIAGLVITSTAASLSQSVKYANSEQPHTVGISLEISSMDANVCTISHAMPAVKKPKNIPSIGTDLLIMHHNDDEDVQNPSVVADPSYTNVLVFAEFYYEIGANSMYGRFSTDEGVNWGEEIFGWEEIPEGDPDDVTVPKLDYYGIENWAYGTFTAGGLYDATNYYMELPSIVDPDYDPNDYGWVLYSLDWTNVADFSDFDSADVGCFPYDPSGSPSEDFWGIIAGTGDRPPGTNEEDDTMMIQYSIPGDRAVIWSWYNMDYDVSKMVTDLDISLRQPYIAMEYVMEDDPSDTGSLFFKSPQLRPDNYPDDNWITDGDFSGFYLEDVYNPDIAAADGSVYVVAETVDGDIICFYSSDAGESFQESIVSDDSIEETFPQVAITGTDVICSYTRDLDLFAKVSHDGGVTWVDELDVNDDPSTAVEQYGCHGIDGPYIAWTDDRNSPPYEIFFDITFTSGSPPSAPTITGKDRVEPGTSTEYSFKSTDADGDQIAEYIVDWGDGDIETITGPFSSGQTVSKSHKWSDQGKYTIKAKAKDTTGLTGPDGIKPIIVPRNRALNYRFFDIFPNFYWFFKIIFG